MLLPLLQSTSNDEEVEQYYTKSTDNVIIHGDFNAEIGEDEGEDIISADAG